jgi:hypothetical protein
MILYTRILSPSENLKVTVTFIIKSYASNLVECESEEHLWAGPSVLFDMIQAVKAAEEYVSTFIPYLDKRKKPFLLYCATR